MMALVQSPLVAEDVLEKKNNTAMERAVRTAILAEIRELVLGLPRLRSPTTSLNAGPKDEVASETETVMKKEPRPSIKLETRNLSFEQPPLTIDCKVKLDPHLTSPKGSTDTKRAVSPVTAVNHLEELLGIDIRRRIQESPTQCLATAKTTCARCRIPVRAQNKQLILGSLDTLSELEVGANSTTCAEELAAFVDLTFCGRHHRRQAQARIEGWKKKTSVIKDSVTSPAPSNSPVKSERSPGRHGELQLIPDERERDVKNEISTARCTSPHPRDMLPPWSLRYDLRPTSARIRNMKKYEAEPRYYHRSPSTIISVDHCLSQTMNKPLGVTALKSGFLYVYRLCGEADFFKIGYTTVGVAHRVSQWEKQCGHKAEVVYPSTEVEEIPIRNVQRIEQLIHAELKACRYREEGCQGCGKNHIEWFKVGEQHLRAVIAKWVDWIQGGQYTEENCIWKLKTQQKKEMDRMCTPLQATIGNFEAEWEPQPPVRSSTLIKSVTTGR